MLWSQWGGVLLTKQLALTFCLSIGQTHGDTAHMQSDIGILQAVASGNCFPACMFVYEAQQ